MTIEPFSINVSTEILNDLAVRLKHAKWPNGLDGAQWKFGTSLAYLKDLLAYWMDEYDWKYQEQQLNRYPQYKCRVGAVDVHFYHVKGKGKRPIPIILSHGWPDSFIRYLKVIPMLADPARFGRDPKDSFDLVIPSLPGFGFSEITDAIGVNNADIADLWKQLMTEKLGYETFAAGGGDMGSSVTRYLAYRYPERLLGIHLTDVGIIRDIIYSEDAAMLSDEEKQYKQAAGKWILQEGAYISIQSTKPQTLSYGLSDSPLGLAAWILEKFQSWSDCNGNLENRFTKDELLNNIMIYWLNNAIGMANHIYYENTHSLTPIDKITVPTGIALFAKDVLPPPQKWVESKFNVVHWTHLPDGGHFTAMESPQLFADDIANFFRRFRAINGLDT